MKFSRVAGLLCAASIVAALAGTAYAQDKVVKIGAIYPLSGNAASAGVHAKAAIELAVDIINNAHPELGNLPLAKAPDLPGLGGAKLEVVFADNQGSPAAGQNQALRLITEEKVVALTGAYQSGITLTASAIAEKYGIPFLNGELVAANLTERGFKWFFRDDPGRVRLRQALSRLPPGHESCGRQDRHRSRSSTRTPNTAPRSPSVIAAVFKENGHHDRPRYPPIPPIRPTCRAQVLQLKEKKPDVVILVSYTSDAILYAKTMQALDYKPPMIIADDSGFSDPSFIKTVGKISQGVFNRSSWDVGAPGTVTYKINEMYKKKSGDDLDDTSARADAGLLRAG